jgi:hypothetical protein
VDEGSGFGLSLKARLIAGSTFANAVASIIHRCLEIPTLPTGNPMGTLCRARDRARETPSQRIAKTKIVRFLKLAQVTNALPPSLGYGDFRLLKYYPEGMKK